MQRIIGRKEGYPNFLDIRKTLIEARRKELDYDPNKPETEGFNTGLAL